MRDSWEPAPSKILEGRGRGDTGRDRRKGPARSTGRDGREERAMGRPERYILEGTEDI